METLSPSSSSVSARREASTFDEFSMQQSLLFTDSLKDLKNLRSQLYSAAEYFEFSYSNDEQKQIVMNTLKDYAVKALVNTVDHLGSVSYKVNGLFDEKVDEVSGAELRLSCIEQRIRTCQEHIDLEGRAQQSLVIAAPRFHKRYIIPEGEPLPESGWKATAVNQERKGDLESQEFCAGIYSTLRDRPPSFRNLRFSSPSPTTRARSESPRKGRSPSPSPRPGKFSTDKRAVSPLPATNPFRRSGSISVRPTILNSSSSVRRLPVEAHKSFSMKLHAERNENKESERLPSKSKSFLKTLLTKRRSKKDEMLYSFIDEY
ncbi:protein ABIL3-like [Phalaenopsis equestris]|uniref:protein ABIL3-like n=1 Tax=Phalaenopsis equestris TaxID=78828 RepID=UPI0009E52CCF|nr:protein ABIL3-like [Phalaenopsis equestris]XP_020586170.1 protein ABIL3-like [Phalaenopsis equestris]XP_020586171.1 protein ABIL3-like [Phalaenopsis equestris]XP_020586172.1 protein ABIL3-like [Phalaenopsis equestris]